MSIEEYRQRKQQWVNAASKATSGWREYKVGQKLLSGVRNDTPAPFDVCTLLAINPKSGEGLIQFHGKRWLLVPLSELAPPEYEDMLRVEAQKWNQYRYSAEGRRVLWEANPLRTPTAPFGFRDVSLTVPE